MKNRQITLFLLLVLSASAVLSGCNKDELDPYTVDNSSVYFTANNKEYSFLATPDAEYYDMEIPVSILGPAADYDREIAYELDTENSTVPDGKYEIRSAVVAAGALSGAIKVRLYNDSSLETDNYKLVIKLLSNAYFSNQLSNLVMTNKKIVFYQSIQIVWDSQEARPEWLLHKYAAKYINYTLVYADAEGNLYGQQDATNSRTLIFTSYRKNGVCSKTFYRILRELWPAKVNNFGYYGRDAETLAQYPYFAAGQEYFNVLIHQLEQYVYNYNQTHDTPLCHSEDATILLATGSIYSVSFGGKTYKLENIKECPILVNPYNQ